MSARNEAEAYVASLALAKAMAREGILTPEELAKAESLLKQRHGIKDGSALVRIMLIQCP